MATVTASGDEELHEKLIRTVKKEVKQIMEEAVTRKFVHEDSGSIISLCAAVDSCLSQGLKRRISGLFKGNLTTTSLLKQLAKQHPEAAQVAQKVQEIESRLEEANKKLGSSNSINGDSPNKPQTSIRATLQQRHLWIRVALFEKQLSKIIELINQESGKYYEKDALMAHPADGPIIASLLVGPCALDYSKMKTADHYWTDPPADELVQRHRIHSMNPGVISTTPASPKRPGLQVKRIHGHQGSSDDHRGAPLSARDYVESLHQNSRSTLLYGKNNVLVQPKEDIQHIPGYLSLHQTAEHLTIKWTPNQLMNGGGGSEESETDPEKSHVSRIRIYWDYAVTVNLEDIVYLHCHQQPDSGGTLVLVGQDGVQYPPIHFPKGGHLLAFLTCLENGLLPRGQLDPPLWSQRGKGKVLPKLRRKTSGLSTNQKEGTQIFEGEEATDYVFRIIKAFKPEYVPEDIIDPKRGKSGGFPWLLRDTGPKHTLIRQQEVLASPTSSTTTSRIYSPSSPNSEIPMMTTATSRSSIKLLCDTMKKQIISRAFYGWLAHCRHLRTVRTHLSGLVDANIIAVDASEGLDAHKWARFMEAGKEVNEEDVMRLVYFGGVAHEIRKEVWPYMLGHYKFGCTEDERRSVDSNTRMTYEQIVAEWMAVEAIIKQRDRDTQAAKLSSENSSEGQIPLQGHDPSLDSEVFELEDEEDNDEYIEAGEVRSTGTGEEMTQEQREIIRKEEYVVIECRNPQEKERHHLKHKHSDASVDEGMGASIASSSSVKSRDSLKHTGTTCSESDVGHDVEEGEVRVELCNGEDSPPTEEVKEEEEDLTQKGKCLGITDTLTAESMAVSPANELLDTFSLNLHRVDKDVQRCDRNYHYFTTANLEKLRNIMCSYVWEHLEIGYVQGMCDLVAPLLVIIDDEAKTYSCFCELMKRMSKNFPHGGAMDTHFANMRSLIQILDSEMFELMHQNGDYTHFYFCYRWFLLDFKRELVYDDTFVVWETIWAAKHCASRDFVLFIALALVEYYRDIILDNNMDFTDIIKFFNEMAERHDAKAILKVARDLVYRVQTLIENK
ncbi:small G protein signaling modulator 1-like [Acanthaster planci]|uniref:Small G protein signaling modulator 1-like n=1 Tax=Acanthaster planci TaxID=133434 RepID=A0A8B7ZTY2_ACAPL|nr:small G protein signaling modulator 1-like [Acanthaster planci]